jgi:hypothetical protein
MSQRILNGPIFLKSFMADAQEFCFHKKNGFKSLGGPHPLQPELSRKRSLQLEFLSFLPSDIPITEPPTNAAKHFRSVNHAMA